MPDLIIKTATISGLPLGLHEGKVLSLKPVNYLFGSNGSGKTLVLKKITEQAKTAIRNTDRQSNGYFAQYITATPQQTFYQDTYMIPDRRASDFDMDNAEISGQTFYQHLAEFPEIRIKVRDTLQKYLGRYPNLVRRGVNNVMRFLREEADIPEYAPQQESDGLRRLALLLTYIYHPKCIFLAIDEPELYLHPDMISFLLEEIHFEVNFGKQFAFATHSPEMIKIGKGDFYGYFYFNLKDKLKDSHIIQASEVGAEPIIEQLGYLLDVNRRAFLYAPVTIFVEGLADEIVYSKLKEQNKVDWSRRVFMINTGGNSNIFNFWLLWKKFDKDCRIILDLPKTGKETEFESDIINKFCNELSIDITLTFENKKTKLIEHNIFIAPFSDVLIFKDKNIELRDFDGAFSTLDVSQHIEILQKAVKIEESKVKKIRKEEEDWLTDIAKEMFGSIINGSNSTSLDDAIVKLKLEHPNLEITKLNEDLKYLAEIRFSVSKSRQLYIKFPKSTTDTEIGVL